MNTSASSISFVITAIYTYTFANAVSRVMEFNDRSVTIGFRDDTSLVSFLCVFICLTMALRFFFGNNNYVDKLYREQHSAVERMYHLVVIVIQSLILLGSSYLIRNPALFFTWIAALFLVELIWYTVCALFLRHAIHGQDGKFDRQLAANEGVNLLMVIGAGFTAWQWTTLQVEAAFIAGAAFGINTVVDGWVNFTSYMGVEAPTQAAPPGRAAAVRAPRPGRDKKA